MVYRFGMAFLVCWLFLGVTVAFAADGIRVDKTKVEVTFYLSDPLPASGLYQKEGLTITSVDAYGFQFRYHQPTLGEGFYYASGGMRLGSKITVPIYINPNKGVGVYEGRATLEYANADNKWLTGPVVEYRIHLLSSPSDNLPSPPVDGFLDKCFPLFNMDCKN